MEKQYKLVKIKTTLFIFCFLISFSFVCAKEFNIKITENNYLDYLSKINLSEKQKAQISKIKEEEEYVLRPLVLDIYSHETGIEYLKSLKCGAFEFECKKKLKADIENKKFEKEEIMHKIAIKKNYYKIRYRNVLTREQDYQIQQMIESKKGIIK